MTKEQVMRYGDGDKIWVTINSTLILVNAATPDSIGLTWERSRRVVKQWVYINGDGFKYHIDLKQVVGPYEPLRPVKYFKNKLNYK